MHKSNQSLHLNAFIKHKKKDIIAKADDIRELERDVRLVRDSQVVHERLQNKDKC